MRKMLLLAALLILTTAGFAQAQNWAPIVWERYKISSQHLSFVLPKLPMVAKQSDDCDSKHTSTYYSYAEGAVYEMRLTTRLKDPFCVGLRPTPFGTATLEKRLGELRDAKDKPSESKETVAGKSAYRFERKASTRLIIVESADPKWWIELAVSCHAGNKPDIYRFFKSLIPKAEGKEIGRGAEFILGDPGGDSNRAVPDASPSGNDASGSADDKDDRYKVLYQPKATYTQKARDADTQGAVRVNITLQANGAVGAVVPITTLKNGLTESAVAAARKIVFLPKRVDGKPVSVIVTREYTFTIY